MIREDQQDALEHQLRGFNDELLDLIIKWGFTSMACMILPNKLHGHFTWGIEPRDSGEVRLIAIFAPHTETNCEICAKKYGQAGEFKEV